MGAALALETLTGAETGRLPGLHFHDLACTGMCCGTDTGS